VTINRSTDRVAGRRPIRWRYSPTVKLIRRLDRSTEIDQHREPRDTTVTALDRRDFDVLDPRFRLSPESVQERAAAGDTCFGIRDRSGALAATAWLASGRHFYISEVGADVWVPAGTAYLYDVFTLPERRGQGMMTALLGRIVAAMKSAERPKEHCEAWVMSRNKPSVRAFRAAGFVAEETFLFASVGSVRISVGRPWLRDGWL
jgi:GNAT superfamily N-acetyltransferase